MHLKPKFQHNGGKYDDQRLQLQRFSIRALSLTCSSSGCEYNWSVFERVRICYHALLINFIITLVHTKKINRVH